MTDDHKPKRSCPQDDLGNEHNGSSRHSSLRAKINEVIENHQIQNQALECSTSESLMNGFIRHIWLEIRDDYDQMTRYLERELKKILSERLIHAEVSSRVKEDASITATLKRRHDDLVVQRRSGFHSYQEILLEMHDLSGLRIVLEDREDRGKAQELINKIFKKQKSPAHFNPNREVGQFWRRPWFGAYETQNHRVQLANDDAAALGGHHRYSGVMFEIQLTTFSDNLYNKLAHDLLYKADPGLVTGQEEMVIDLSHGLARCFELCMTILRPKLHRDTDKKMVHKAEDFGEPTEKEARLAQTVVEEFERDLYDQSKSDRTAQLLRFVIPKDSPLISYYILNVCQKTSEREGRR